MIEPWVAIQRNPRSGSGRRKRHLLGLVQALKRHGLRPRVFSKREKLAARLAEPERREALHCLVAAGGDGTVSDLMNRYPDLPICPFPLGTENLLCKHLGIPLDEDRVAKIIATGHRRQFDVGQIGDHRFLLMASAGFDAEVIQRLHHNRTGNIRHLSYIKPILQTAFGYHHAPVRVFLDDNETPVEGSMIVVSNIPAYAFRIPITPDATGDDGRFNVVVFQRPGSFQLFRYWLMVMRRRHYECPHVFHAEAARIRLESDSPVPVQTDGDPRGTTGCEINVLANGVTLIAPGS